MKILEKFSTQDLLYIAIFSSLGLALKPIIAPLVHLVSTPLMIPGGSLAGGFYMMWLVLAIVIVNKPGTGTLFGIVQAVIVMCLGFWGNLGSISLICYTLPGVISDFLAFFIKRKELVLSQCIICATANLTGTLFVTILVFRLPSIPLFIALATSAVSGVLGGIVSYLLYKKLINYRLIYIQK